MIKVIKHGKPTKKLICDRCGCKFRYGNQDIECASIPKLYPEHYMLQRAYFIICPDCGKTIELKSSLD